MKSPIRLENVWKTYHTGSNREVHAVADVTLEIVEGKATAIAGPSGAGKTTLLSIISLLTSPSRGEVFLRGTSISGTSEVFKTKMRREEIGIVFQSEYLFPHLSAIENVALPKLCTDMSISNAEEQAEEKLEKLELSHRKNFRVAELSGGEKQRVSIARALINSPRILIADEPGSSMDVDLTTNTLSQLRQLIDQEEMTVVVASHNTRVLDWADTVVDIRNGRIE
ncbi:MAG: ATP-binding cassette domain-containing protein [Candidatus Lokiarchaeota archaeon]|nr:ATP-binding cassette domain-containing protein [Candidatus Lokiarchaeota archaeon]